MKHIKMTAVFLAAALCMAGCAGKAVLTTATEEQRSGVEYFADQMSEAAKENAERRAEEAEQARNEGDGDKSVIRSVDDLVKFRERVNGGEPALDAVLDADLDLSSICGPNVGSWEPIEKYNGVFEGNGHTISNLFYSGSGEDKGGLFATTDRDSLIQNLTMENVQIDGGDYVGAVAGHAQGSIVNCVSRGEITGTGRSAGGIAGRVDGSLNDSKGGSVVSGCTNYATIINTGEVKCIAGGVVGDLINANAGSCRNEGKVSGNATTIGGVFGVLEGSASEPIVVEDCVNVAEVDGNIYVGGFCGDAEFCILNRCKNSGAVTGNIYVGGFCGYFGGGKTSHKKLVALMENCVNEGTVSLKYMQKNEYLKPGKAVYENQQIGGLSGITDAGIILNCRTSGDLLCTTGKDYLYCGAGYLAVGKREGDRNLILNCISTGRITPPENSEHFESSRLVTGRGNGHEDAANIFYAGEKAYEEIAPTEDNAFLDGTVLQQLNSFPDGVAESLMTRLADFGYEYEICQWKAEADSMPVLDWE